MKLPMWLVVAMLGSSLLIVLTAAGWWWVRWPERTAREFVDLMAAKKWEDAKHLMAPSPTLGPGTNIIFVDDESVAWSQVAPKPESRSFADVFAGRQKFDLAPSWEIVAQRGRVQQIQVDLNDGHPIWLWYRSLFRDSHTSW
jgi:hypothetical protein